MRIAESELIINGDGSVFHLHLRPEELADNVILVGDPGRVDMIAEYFDEKEFRHSSREFVSVTGKYKGVRMTVLSTGIGTDNIDIVMNELDALAKAMEMPIGTEEEKIAKIAAVKDLYAQLGVEQQAKEEIVRLHNQAMESVEKLGLTTEKKEALVHYAETLLGRKK